MNLFTKLIALTLAFFNGLRDRVVRYHRRRFPAGQAGLETLEWVALAALVLVAIVTIFWPALSNIFQGWINKIPK
ncbi:hypothetical protein [Arthrobacter woluwensis]|uniref:hypothetical protein n=1 Tax=Arthrobacter woluwensis TaxID=156980 RepID=UPI00382FDC85